MITEYRHSATVSEITKVVMRKISPETKIFSSQASLRYAHQLTSESNAGLAVNYRGLY